ncbi:MAG: response regulator [Sphingomonas sp.]|jgi:two-component system chemotaxis response regulator CheB|uniref:response regulator n=1 Tax=Sphingomonas sp. TaxID=28214 RepID=UPI003562986F
MTGFAPGGVLIIDDSLTVRAIIEEMLSADRDWRVVGSASDVDTARALIAELRPSVITLDLAMPGIDGMSFLDELAASPHAPVLVVSSHTRDGSDTAQEAVARGAVACFDKAHLVSHAKDFRRILGKSARARDPRHCFPR